MKIRIDIDTEKFESQIAVIDEPSVNENNEPFMFGYSTSLENLLKGLKQDIKMIVGND